MTDWDVFRAACWALLSGQNPYTVGQGQMVFFTPPWALIPLIPFALLPPFAGLAGLALVSLFSLLFVSRHMLYGNVEWLPLLGLLAPPPLPMRLYATKPQASAGLIALLLIAQWKAARWRVLLITLAPTIVLGVLSVIIWGLPPVPGPNNPGQHSLFPFSLLFGLPALYLALTKNNQRTAGFVGPFTSPYVSFHGYLPALFPFRGKWMGLALLVSFIPVVLGLVD